MGTRRAWVLAVGFVVPLLLAGCKSGGSGGTAGLFESLFGGGSSGSSDSSGSISDLASLDVGSSGGPVGFDAPSAAVAHTPEPASVALFGTGLAGLALWRRRRGSARTPRS